MKGILIQLYNKDQNLIGTWYTEEKELMENTGMLGFWFKGYIHTDMYQEERVPGFVDFVKTMGYEMEEVFMYSEIIHV